jgi:hypothetical protein
MKRVSGCSALTEPSSTHFRISDVSREYVATAFSIDVQIASDDMSNLLYVLIPV